MGRSNYINEMVKRFGDYWIVALKPEDIQRSGKRIFKEMVRGNIDYETEGNYFLDPKFLENLIISCNNELEINTLYYNAVSFYQQYNPGVPNIGPQISHLQIVCYIYSALLNKLNMVKQYQTIGYLADTSALLYSYRNHLN